MADISKDELQKEIAKILKDAKLDQTSTKKVIQKLEKNLGVDLSEKRKLIDQLVMDYVNSMDSGEDDKDDEEDEDKDDGSADDDDEEEVKPKKEEKKKAKKDKKVSKDDDEEMEHDDSNDSDWGVRKKRSSQNKSTDGEEKKKKPKTKKAGVGKRAKGSGYTRSYKLSPALSELMGATEMPRHEVVKRIWAIVKEKQLYDPNNKQFTICDKPLYKVFGTQRFRTFGMMKYLKTHFLEE